MHVPLFIPKKMDTNKIGITSKILALLAAIALIISLFVPLWRIDLDAPQYPEGLGLLIYPHKIGGDVDIINGLNHYIGMQTLHTDNFIEFTLLPYLIGFFAILMASVAVVGKKKYLNITFTLFVIFGAVSMIDFWRWEYNYGHNLDPNAAIIVPGMAYQPPLIGFKQLLNFGAYSIPSTGGWLFIVAGLLLLFAITIEYNWLGKIRFEPKVKIFPILMMLLMIACSDNGPEKINLHKDKCDFCKMTIADNRFAAEAKTEKGRIYKFDDLSCMSAYTQENNTISYPFLWVSNYQNPNQLIDATKAHYLKSDGFKSPMGGNTAAFETSTEAQKHVADLQLIIQNWQQVQNKN